MSLSAFFACNKDDDDYTTSITASGDAQIYSFALSAKRYDAVDSLTYPVLGKTLFSIDQFQHLIYNVDSLPHNIRLKNFYAAVTFPTGGTSSVNLIYPDTVVEWNKSDSVDFKRGIPTFQVKAADGNTTYEYRLDLRIHKIDPDVIGWLQSWSLPGAMVKQKTVLDGENATFYTLAKNNGNNTQLYIYKSEKASLAYDGGTGVAGLPAPDNVVLESFTSLNGKFFVADNSDNAYVSTDNGLNWSNAGMKTYSIIGILPGSTQADDEILAVVDNGGKYCFAKTKDFGTVDIIRELSTYEANNMPMTGFSSTTSYTRSNLNTNILSITGGRNKSNVSTNLTWSFKVDDKGALQVVSNQQHTVFPARDGIVSFNYDGYLYALTGNVLYKTSSLGYLWTEASTKEQLPSDMPRTSSQSVIVDSENYIWIFGGITDSGNTLSPQIWRGRLNKLNPR
ncbi:hypothetical protein D0T57_09825 [Dysgonomonas sp. 511]|nr:hypothetical protein [Dysgonomonas sp. 511]